MAGSGRSGGRGRGAAGRPRSAELYARARRLVPSGVNSPVRYYPPHPVFIRRAEGAHVWDADGRRYTDMCCGFGALLFGHGRPEIVDAVSRQLRRGTLYCAPTEMEVELASLIAGNYPSMRRVRLVNTGAEATMAAIRLARGHTGRRKIIKFDGCYHGAHDPVLVKAGSGSAHAGIAVSAGVTPGAARDTVVVPYNDAAALEDAAERNRDDLAGIIVEPVLGNMGVVPPLPGFLPAARRAARRHGAPLIFDETITGFRVSEGGAQKAYGVRPDITTLGKALGGGLPIAAVGGRADILDSLAPGGDVYQASTFAGNPVSVAAAIASVRLVNRAKGRLYAALEARAARLASAAADAAADLRVPHTVNRVSSMFQVFFADGPVTDADSARAADGGRFDALFRGLLDAGVFAAASQFEAAMLSSAHADDDVAAVEEAYASAMKRAAKAAAVKGTAAAAAQ